MATIYFYPASTLQLMFLVFLRSSTQLLIFCWQVNRLWRKLSEFVSCEKRKSWTRRRRTWRRQVRPSNTQHSSSISKPHISSCGHSGRGKRRNVLSVYSRRESEATSETSTTTPHDDAEPAPFSSSLTSRLKGIVDSDSEWTVTSHQNDVTSVLTNQRQVLKQPLQKSFIDWVFVIFFLVALIVVYCIVCSIFCWLFWVDISFYSWYIWFVLLQFCHDQKSN